MNAHDLFAGLEDDERDEPWFKEPRDREPWSEFERQRSVVAELRRNAPQALVFAVPNGSKDSDWSRIRKFREGAMAGMTDLVILWKHGALFAEMKNGQTDPRPSQRAVLNKLHRLGFRCGVYRKPLTLIAHLKEAGCPFNRLS